ncbi:S8 family serine peptidase [Streptomyces sp. NPDC050636]|uniref:S8 family serine peptidase n=1 Tax=Streptomyces sp. NPDC050636 TaxID=3154510 RepID=UPI00342D012F
MASAWLVSEDASASDYLLVQTTEVPTAEEKEQLAALGVVIHEYVPESTYLCGYRPADLEAVRALPFVAWSDLYLKGFKIAPSLRPSSRLRPAVAVLADPLETAGPRTRTVDVVLHEDVDAGSDGVRERIAGAAGVGTGDLQPNHRKVRMTVREQDLSALASLDEVRHVEEAPEVGLYNTVARTLMRTQVSLNGTRFRGEGQVVAVADTGFDLGSTTDVHPAFTGRVKRLIALGRTSPKRADDPDGHGTHVAGSVLGDGTSASMGGAVTGTAPEAKLVLQSLLDKNGKLGGVPLDLRDLFDPPFLQDGARIHTNSWGPIDPSLPYDSSAFEADKMVWDNKEFVICFAAGNDGHDQDRDGHINQASVSGQAGAKNCITIGASESSRPDISKTYGQLDGISFPANPIRDDLMADNPDGMAAFSSRGPSQEGRFKPDVVGPGTSILSAHSRVAGTDIRFGVSSDPAFSMLINGAEDLRGQYSPTEAGASPNNNSGFGRVNLERSVIFPGSGDRAGFADEDELEQGEKRSFPITIPEGADRNNIEQVRWQAIPAGEAEVVVRAHRITQFAQPYAVAWRVS